jgi:hypothetical protein
MLKGTEVSRFGGQLLDPRFRIDPTLGSQSLH